MIDIFIEVRLAPLVCGIVCPPAEAGGNSPVRMPKQKAFAYNKSFLFYKFYEKMRVPNAEMKIL